MTVRNGSAVLGLFLVGFACADELPTSRDPRLDAAVMIGDGGTTDALEVPCPDGEPKVGEGCPVGFVETNTCTYVVGMCMIPNGNIHNEYVTFCCSRGQWANCGGSSVCDQYDGGVPPAMDAPPAPVEASTGDGGVDAPGDAPADAADASVDAAAG